MSFDIDFKFTGLYYRRAACRRQPRLLHNPGPPQHGLNAGHDLTRENLPALVAALPNLAEVSIGRLFLAGIVPGLLLAGLFMAYIYITARRHPEMAPRGEHYPFRDRVRSSMGLLPILSLFLLVLGSIVTGACSPTEGGAIGAAGVRCLSESEGKGFAFLVISMGIAETVGLFGWVLLFLVLPVVTR